MDKLDYANLKESDFKSKEELQNSPNIEYWKKLQDIYNTEDIFAILKQRCGNCAAFNITDKMRDCIKKVSEMKHQQNQLLKLVKLDIVDF